MELERRGLPVLVICSDQFEALGRAQAETLGSKSLRLGIIRHPLGGVSEQELEDRCRTAYRETRAWLDEVLGAPGRAVGES